jgi:hypothetical protein
VRVTGARGAGLWAGAVACGATGAGVGVAAGACGCGRATGGVTGAIVGSGSGRVGRVPGSEKSRISAGPTVFVSGCAWKAAAGAANVSAPNAARPDLRSMVTEREVVICR